MSDRGHVDTPIEVNHGVKSGGNLVYSIDVVR